ncbi:polyketide cyclase [Streptomyces oceani]|uniref:Polyketide cyclase n=1 Tax=Streptomyces oceani TaxID=1075402 RepID=A0A1E7JYI7_9ACTN|nr:SRPBCC family protein [Streptomyces oceani]OEU96768.1 polyketide cyclase [Streptomyces oceani]
MRWHYYEFHAVWRLSATPAEVYAVLADAERYPSWWPQVREVYPLDGDAGMACFRSFLPYELRVTARALRRDEATGVLEMAMTGDLQGHVRWTIARDTADPRLVRAEFDQCVEVRKRSLRWFALPGRPLFLANHALMMRAGLRGLRRRLAHGLDEA